MDPKEQDLIRQFHLRIQSGLFDEKDVFAWLVLLREHASGPAKEFGHFMVHRRRHRGDFFEFVTSRGAEWVEWPPSVSEAQKRVAEAPPVFELEEIARSFNRALDSLQLSQLSEGQVEDTVLCVMSLLQWSGYEGSGGDTLGRSLLAYDQDHVTMFFVRGEDYVFSTFMPVLRVSNRYQSFHERTDRHFMTTPNEYLTVVNVNGNLRFSSA